MQWRGASGEAGPAPRVHEWDAERGGGGDRARDLGRRLGEAHGAGASGGGARVASVDVELEGLGPHPVGAEDGCERRDEPVDQLGSDDGFGGVRVRRVGVDPPMLPTTPTTFAAVAELQLTTFVDAARPEILASLVEWLRIPADLRRPRPHRRRPGLGHLVCRPDAGRRSRARDGCWRRPATRRCTATGSTPGRRTHGRRLRPSRRPARRPARAWVSPPFEPTDPRRSSCSRRGAVDDKGQVLYHLEVIRALLARDGALPVNLKLLVEGEEEVGSPNFEVLLAEHRDLLECDVVVVSDTAMWSADVPSMCVRGCAASSRSRSRPHRDERPAFGIVRRRGAQRRARRGGARDRAPRRRRARHAARLLRRGPARHRRRPRHDRRAPLLRRRVRRQRCGQRRARARPASPRWNGSGCGRRPSHRDPVRVRRAWE